MNTLLHANELPVLTWNRFNVNYKQIELSNTADSKIEPNITGSTNNINIKDIAVSDELPVIGSNDKVINYIMANASLRKKIVVNKNSHNDLPLIIDLTMHNDDKLTALFDIILEENSTANIIISVSAAVKAHGQYADLIRIKAAAHAKANITFLQLSGQSSIAFNNIIAQLDNEAHIKIHQIPLGGKTALASVTANLTGYKSSVEIYADYIGQSEQDIDLNYVACHYGSKSTSDIKMNGILLDSSKKTARGTIDFHRGCKGASGNESEHVLLLSDKVKNKSVPLILCDEDDVAGNHGAAIGTLDEEPLFYLKSRGIDEKAARQIFLDSTLSRLKNILPANLAAKIDNYSKDVLCNESI